MRKLETLFKEFINAPIQIYSGATFKKGLQSLADINANTVSGDVVVVRGFPENNVSPIQLNAGVEIIYGSPSFLESETYVTLNLTNTAAVLQAIIDSYPKNLNGHTLIFSFAGEAPRKLLFNNFFNGELKIDAYECSGSENVSGTLLTFSNVKAKILIMDFLIEFESYSLDRAISLVDCPDVFIEAIGLITNADRILEGILIYNSKVVIIAYEEDTGGSCQDAIRATISDIYMAEGSNMGNIIATEGSIVKLGFTHGAISVDDSSMTIKPT